MSKKIFISLAFLLLLMSSVSALNIDYRCCNIFDYCICPEGYLEGLDDEGDTPAAVSSRDSSSGSGLSINKFLDKYVPLLRAFYVPIEDYRALEDRVFMLEARLEMLDEGYLFLVPEHQYLVLLRAATMKQTMYNVSKVSFMDYTCMESICIK